VAVRLMPEAICAACGAKGPHGRIRCLKCGKPLMFASEVRPSLADEQQAAEVLALVREIRPLLAGKDPSVQGAVLADLLAMWLAGHVHLGDPEATKRARELMLEMHIVGVKALIDINYQITVEPQIKARTQ
jgi:hypothetical protein